MQFRNAAVVTVALLVALSGCSALGGTPAGEPANETDTKSVTDPVTNGSDDANTTSTVEPNGTEDDTSTDRSDDTADTAWYPPEEPNRPLEDKREDRIESVTFVDKVPAESGDGYSNFNLEVVANTSMEDVDPAEHGDLEGEPYFFVKINEGEDNRKIIERTDEVRMNENGTFHIDVRPAGIEEFGAGSLTVEVFLMDEDKDWDDIYDAVGTEIQYTPDTDANGSSSTASDSEPAEN